MTPGGGLGDVKNQAGAGLMEAAGATPTGLHVNQIIITA